MKLPVLLLCSVLLLSVSVLSQEDEGSAAGQETSEGGETSATPRDAQCGNYGLPACPRNSAPVCGTDGKTYSNECMLCYHNMEKNATVRVQRSGECDSNQ